MSTSATTEDGRRVLLMNDGTWKFVSTTTENPIPTKATAICFRKANWGMTKDQVRETEYSEHDSDHDNILMYKGTLGTQSVNIGYVFAESQLVRGVYLVTTDHANSNDYITDYDSMKSLLTKKYGEPEEDEVVWKNDLYQDDPQQHGMAISAGHLALYSSWSYEDTELTLMLRGDNYEINHTITYVSKTLGELEGQASEEATLNDL